MKSLLTRCAVIVAAGLILVTQLALVTGERAHAVAPWTPASLGSSLAVWLDASDASTLTSSGGLVSEWRDKSGNARHAVQATSGSRPTLNGSAISISDYNKFMTGAMAANSLPTSIQVTVVFTASGSGRNGYQSHPFTRTTNNYPTPYDGYNSNLLVGGPTGNYNWFDGYADIRNLTTRTVLSTSMSATKVEQYLNGTLQKSDSGSFWYQDVPSIFYVGTRADRYTHFTGEINEIVVTNELSSSDRASLGSYLGAKWAVSGFPSPPAVSVAPVITGTPRTGDTLSASTGSWTGTPTSYAYQWQRSLTSGGSLIDIANATNSTYVVSEFDVGYFIKVSVSATNGIGTSSAASSLETTAVVDIAPTNTAVPLITGTARTGATLTATTGSWTSSPSPSTTYTYQWKRANTSGGSYTDITSAVNSTYVLTDADIGKYIKVAVVATNTAAPSTAALSAATSVVVDLADSVVPTATTPVATATGFTFTISNYSASYTYALTTTKGTVSRLAEDVTVAGLSAGESVTVTIAVTRTNYKPASKTVTGSAIPPATTTTTTTAAPALSIVIQAPVTTVAQGQVSVATVAPTTTSTTIVVLGANGLPAPTTTTIAPPKPAATTTTILPAIVTTTTVGPPEVAKVSAGETAVQVDGVTTDAVVTRENNQMVVTAGSLSATLSSLDNTGKTSPLDSDGNVHLTAGDVIKISVGGFEPGSQVEVWLFSTPTKLGSAVVGADGSINGLFTIPLGIKSGSHRVVISAKLANGKPTTFTLGILVGKISKTSTLTRVLIAIPISFAVIFGFLLPTQLRRRRRLA
ncbi:MAG: hypothetical protein WCG33_04050 [Actinomycetes bacterium]